MEFSEVYQTEALNSPAIILLPEATAAAIDELVETKHWQFRHGNAYPVDNVKEFMRRNKLNSASIVYTKSKPVSM